MAQTWWFLRAMRAALQWHVPQSNETEGHFGLVLTAPGPFGSCTGHPQYNLFDDRLHSLAQAKRFLFLFAFPCSKKQSSEKSKEKDKKDDRKDRDRKRSRSRSRDRKDKSRDKDRSRRRSRSRSRDRKRRSRSRDRCAKAAFGRLAKDFCCAMKKKGCFALAVPIVGRRKCGRQVLLAFLPQWRGVAKSQPAFFGSGANFFDNVRFAMTCRKVTILFTQEF
jgi:hypothetical protein